jgi:hypothetical protein
VTETGIATETAMTIVNTNTNITAQGGINWQFLLPRGLLPPIIYPVPLSLLYLVHTPMSQFLLDPSPRPDLHLHYLTIPPLNLECLRPDRVHQIQIVSPDSWRY